MSLKGSEEQSMEASICPKISVGLKGDMDGILTAMLT